MFPSSVLHKSLQDLVDCPYVDIMNSQSWRWILGCVYLCTVASIWIVASFVIQFLVDGGVSPFLITYISNSLFVIYIPLVEIARYLEQMYASVFIWRKRKELRFDDDELISTSILVLEKVGYNELGISECGLNSRREWTRTRIAKVSLLLCPIWFVAQLTFNLSLKYTTVTSNSILSSCSSLFTFLLSISFLDEKFSWLKLGSVLLCIGGTITVSLVDTKSGQTKIASNPVVGDTLALLSSFFYAAYIILVRLKLPDEDKLDDHRGEGEKNGQQLSMGHFLGFIGFFNILLFFPVVVVLEMTKIASFNALTWKQIGLIVSNGLLDNVVSDFLWAKAVFLTNPTMATAGLTIQVPLAAIVDTVRGNAPQTMDIIGALAVLVGFAGMNIDPAVFSSPKDGDQSLENGIVKADNQLQQKELCETS